MSDEELTEAIVRVKGFGTWSAQMFLLFHLGRSDVWPFEDLGIRKAIAAFDGLGDLPKPSEIKSRGDLWCPYRSVASWYLWRLLDMGMQDVGW
jgi:3-methyladenine DNA glycosylase/8-oxoguanine DNA glycosylase